MAKKRRNTKPHWIKEEAQKRINTLMQQAEENKLIHPERSRRYCELATKISQKYKVPLGKYKHKFCKNCYTYFTADTIKKRKIPKTTMFQITCLHCGKKTKQAAKPQKTPNRKKQTTNLNKKEEKKKNDIIKEPYKTAVKRA